MAECFKMRCRFFKVVVEFSFALWDLKCTLKRSGIEFKLIRCFSNLSRKVFNVQNLQKVYGATWLLPN